MRRWTTLLLLIGAAALAAPTDLRGWTQGTPASGAARVLTGPAEGELPDLTFPKAFAKRLSTRTFVFYFSPNCPHCMAVGKEVGDLARSLSLPVLGVASGSSLPADVDAFKKTYGIDFDILIDDSREIGASMGARSTPSALLVEPLGKTGKHRIVDVWYPYQPGFDIYVKMRATKDPFSVFSGYQGDGACVACHTTEAQSWALTHHSVAWRTLVDDDKHTDPKCVACHVTGHGQPGGWTGPDTPDLVGVGCESCHGPSGPHDGVRTDANTTCAGCHDAEHSIQFSLAKGLPLIDHYAANALDEEGWRKRRMALVDGELPRALLAFAPDPTVGAAACKSCHEAEYAQWASTPHSKAMTVLRDQEKEKEPGCVKCHATAMQGGPPPETLAGFRVQEGVGCEACHGPGGAHVAAKGGRDNIEKLGDDCPVCVIEAVCTSCHDAANDKDWSLDTHLPKAGHAPKVPPGSTVRP